MRVLVTGAKGFMGQNLVASLEAIRDGKDRRPQYHALLPLEVMTCDIQTTGAQLAAMCAHADAVVHLAGVNRPKNDAEFEAGNLGSLEMVLGALEAAGNPCPVILSSSIQASLVGRYAGSAYGKSKLAYFIAVSTVEPTIATTSDLLSTGVDAKTTKVLALDKHIVSMTQFKQIVGRGTRVREDVGKTHFTILDFRGVTRLFADPDWDGPPLQDPAYTGSGTTDDDGGAPGTGDGDGHGDGPRGSGNSAVHEPAPKPYVDAHGCPVRITHKTVAIYDMDGKLLRQENIIDYTRENVRGNYGDLAAFIRTWTASAKKRAIADALRTHGIDLDALKRDMGMADVDDFDFLCHVAYDQRPLTRRERAEGVKKTDFLHRYSGAARDVLGVLLDAYQNLGIKEMENPAVFRLADFQRFGTLAKIAKLFGGKAAFQSALHALEQELYKIG